MKDNKNQITTNNQSKFQAETLTDLPVAEKQAEETRGGENYTRQIEISSFSWGATNSGAHA